MEDDDRKNFRVYRKRWAVLLVVALLNISNGAVWISYFPVANLTANYFEKTSAAINFFSFVFMIVPLLCFVVTTYLSNRKGLKFLVYTGSLFNFTGAGLKAVATSGLFPDKTTQYYVALGGQTVAAVAQTFSIYIPTKVSHSWFPSRERGISTGVLALCYSFGVTVTQVVTPLIVKEETDIPTIDYICFGLAAVVQSLTVLFITRSHPKTPPSATAGKERESPLPYITQLREVFRSKSFLFLLLMLSCGVGIVAGLNTLTQQIICSVGYSNEFAGICIAVMYSSGYLSAIVFTPIFRSTKYFEEMVKMFMAFACITFISLCEVIIIPNVTWLVGLMYSLYGASSTGMFPVGLEMTVEATYPVDESITTGLVYFFGQIFAIIVIALVPTLAKEAPNSEHNSCGLDVNQTPLDYSVSVSVVMVILCLSFLSSVIFYKPEFKRKNFEVSKKTSKTTHGRSSPAPPPYSI